MEKGQVTRNFSNNEQHDAGEYLVSVLEHIFEESRLLQNFDEQMFGGLWQTSLSCTHCTTKTDLEINKMPEIVPLLLYNCLRIMTTFPHIIPPLDNPNSSMAYALIQLQEQNLPDVTNLLVLSLYFNGNDNGSLVKS